MLFRVLAIATMVLFSSVGLTAASLLPTVQYTGVQPFAGNTYKHSYQLELPADMIIHRGDVAAVFPDWDSFLLDFTSLFAVRAIEQFAGIPSNDPNLFDIQFVEQAEQVSGPAILAGIGLISSYSNTTIGSVYTQIGSQIYTSRVPLPSLLQGPQNDDPAGSPGTVPEPATWAVASLGVGIMLIIKRRRLTA